MRRLVYIHPPKCAGTSIVRALRLRYHIRGRGLTAHSMRSLIEASGAAADYVTYEYLANAAADAVAAHRLANGIRLVAGHFWYGTYLRMLNRSCLRMTVIREPVERFLSHYRFLVWKCGLNADLDEFLASHRAKQLGSIYGFYFANRYPQSAWEEREIVDRAIETLRQFDLIGDVSDTSGFLREAKRFIGGPLFSLRSNRTPNAVRPSLAVTASRVQRERIHELTSIDRQIYDQAVSLSHYCRSSTPDVRKQPSQPMTVPTTNM